MTELPGRWGRRGAAVLLCLGVVLAGYYLLFGGEYSVFDIRELEETRRQARERVDSLQARVDSVALRADSLAVDSLAVERLARERYGFIRDGERLYRFVQVAPPDSARPPVDRGNPEE